jgi:hypothetical protein
MMTIPQYYKDRDMLGSILDAEDRSAVPHAGNESS